MAKTFVVSDTSGGAGTSADQLSGTAVEFAGVSGHVRAYFASTLTTTTATLKGARSGEIIPSGCNPNVVGPITAQVGDLNSFIFDGYVASRDKLVLDVVRIGTETWSIGVIVD